MGSTSNQGSISGHLFLNRARRGNVVAVEIATRFPHSHRRYYDDGEGFIHHVRGLYSWLLSPMASEPLTDLTAGTSRTEPAVTVLDL